MALGSLNIQTGSQSSRHRLENHIYLTTAGVLCRLTHGTNLNVGRAAGDTDNHTERGAEEVAIGLHHLNHTAQHLLGSVEVCNDAIFQGADSLDVLVGLTVHHTRLLTDSHYLVGVDVHRDNRRLINHNLSVVNDKSIGSSKVNCQLLCQ